MIVVVSKPELQYTGNFSWIDDDAEGWDLSGDTGRLSTVRFQYVKSGDSAYHVTLRKYSYGRTHDDAQRRANKVQYYISSKDSVLDIGNGYTVDKESKFRGQQVEIEIQVPAGKKIYFDPSVTEKLNPSDFKFRRSRRHTTRVNGRITVDYYTDNDYFRFQTGVDYTMGIDGKLRDPAGRILDRYNYNWYDAARKPNKIRVKKQIKNEKRKKEESEKKIKELEKKQKEIKPTTGKKESMESNDEGTVAKSSVPVFSLVESFF